MFASACSIGTAPPTPRLAQANESELAVSSAPFSPFNHTG